MISILKKIVDQKHKDIERAKSKVSLAELEAKIQNTPPPLDFQAALVANSDVSLIAEVKRASPSKGLIREDFDPVQIANAYQENGASCISVLTDEHFFQGHLDFLREVRGNVDIPVLRKDFILDPYQVVEARAAGADAVLLIAECLTPSQLKDLHAVIAELKMTALVELYDSKNIESVLACNPTLVGVNNRDLNTFEIDLQHSIRIKQNLPEEIAMVSESGIFTNQDVQLMAENKVDAILVGESLMRADDIDQAVKTLLGR